MLHQKMAVPESNYKQPSVVVVMVPLPAQGHLNQLLHLAHLIASYGIPVHYVGSASHNRQVKLRLHGWDCHSSVTSNIHFHDFQLPPYDSSSSPPSHTIGHSITFPQRFIPLFKASTTHLRQPTYHLLQQLSEMFDRVVLIHDLMMTDAVQDFKLLPKSEAYTFNAPSAFSYFNSMWDSIPNNLKPFQLDPNDIPDCIPTFEGCITPEMMDWVVHQFQHLGFESGWILDTSRTIEGRYVELIEKLSLIKGGNVKYFALGPFNPVHIRSKSVETRHQCLGWLDEQEKDSVIYVSFGSSVSLKDDQIEELANGLEKSGEKFLWAVKAADPNDIFAQSDEVKRPQLPQGFEERVQGRGMVVRDWAPQLEILDHPSVGGFMSHCGWNSCMESISMGVPIAAWPMHSDQPRNATLVCDVLGTGMLVRDWAHRSELVTSTMVEKVVKTMIASEQGKEMKKRATKLSEQVRASVAPKGATYVERNAFIAHITRPTS